MATKLDLMKSAEQLRNSVRMDEEGLVDSGIFYKEDVVGVALVHQRQDVVMLVDLTATIAENTSSIRKWMKIVAALLVVIAFLLAR
jgi:hypothetical protein